MPCGNECSSWPAAGSRFLHCVSVCGTTEESAVDRLDRVIEIRERAEAELGATFHVHSDACYGGYAAALTRADGSRRTAAEIQAGSGSAWPDDEWVAAMSALGQADSVSIDPHKIGYVPYSAGAILVRDGRTRHLVPANRPISRPADTSESGGAIPGSLYPGRIQTRALQLRRSG